MKKKSTSKPVRRPVLRSSSATEGGSPWLAIIFKRRRLREGGPDLRSFSEGGFINLRVLIASVFCLASVFIALIGAGLLVSSKAQAQPGPGSPAAAATSASGPDVVNLVGPVRSDQHLQDLPYIPPAPHIRKRLLKPYEKRGASLSQTPGLAQFESLINGLLQPEPGMPTPLLTFDGIRLQTFNGINSIGAGKGIPPDTNGDVGPNHYVQSVNDSFRVFDKSGNPLTPAITFNSFFAPLGNGTPCGKRQNEGDPFVFYDQLADRWVITDFAWLADENGEPATPPYFECIGVSQTPDPTGRYFLYALQTDPKARGFFGDYPKFGLWPDAYYLTMNVFAPLFPDPDEQFRGVRVYALDRASMIGGGPANAVGFFISKRQTGLGKATSLVPATFRTGDPPPDGEREFLLAVDGTNDEILTKVKGWLFHVDFVTPANSTLGVGEGHAPNALITVSGFLNAPGEEVPQPGTFQELDLVGDRMMTPLVYQNRNGTESLWASKTVSLTYIGPTAIRWYQFDVTGGNFPATPVQQQDWSNGNDGLWRWMPSIAVDANGNTAIGYSVSSPSIFPGIRYAGRFASDPLNDLSQGEAIMTNGHGSQTGEELDDDRWGDYTMTTIDPSDGLSFWHTNEYYRAENEGWFTRVGKFQFGPPMSTLQNISARGFVQTGDNVMIGGFMVQGTQPKKVIIRAIGPDLTQHGVPDALANPTLELYDGTGALIASNNNWATTIIGGIITSNQVPEIQASGYAPGNPLDSAIIADLPAGNYTAVVRGVNNLTGVALSEVYSLSPTSNSVLGNISARSFVQTGDNVMIGGFMVQGTEPKRVIIRAIGPDLTQYGVPDALANPTLELYDGTGALIASNNNWRNTIIGGIITSNQVHEIQASGYAPGDPLDSAIIADLPEGNYTAIVRGVNNLTGVGLVEVYNLQ
jgi:hypothetical protein